MSPQATSPSRSSGGRTEQGNGRDHSLNGSSASRPTAGSIARIGLIAGAVAGMMMAMWQMVVGALADEPTAVEGVTSSFWTAVTSIPSVLFGIDWFHEDFEFGAVALGLGGHMMNAMMLGIVGVALLIAVQGRRPSPLRAMMQGAMLGLVLEATAPAARPSPGSRGRSAAAGHRGRPRHRGRPTSRHDALSPVRLTRWPAAVSKQVSARRPAAVRG